MVDKSESIKLQSVLVAALAEEASVEVEVLQLWTLHRDLQNADICQVAMVAEDVVATTKAAMVAMLAASNHMEVATEVKVCSIKRSLPTSLLSVLQQASHLTTRIGVNLLLLSRAVLVSSQDVSDKHLADNSYSTRQLSAAGRSKLSSSARQWTTASKWAVVGARQTTNRFSYTNLICRKTPRSVYTLSISSPSRGL